MTYTPTGIDLVVIKAVDPPGPTVFCRHGDGIAKFSSSAGWQLTKRPKRVSMTEYMGIDPYTLTVPIQFGSGYDTGVAVDPVVEVLRGMMRNPVGPRNEPAVVTIQCPLIPLNWLHYVIQDLVPKEQLVNEGGGRYFASYDMVLYQWEPNDLTVSVSAGMSVAQRVASAPVAQSSGTAPAAAGTAAPAVASGWTYTVKSGDTLSSIAATYLGDASQWTTIASLNGIRDPRNITPGQVLRMPGANPASGYSDTGLSAPAASIAAGVPHGAVA